jgi:hypothetical protein
MEFKMKYLIILILVISCAGKPPVEKFNDGIEEQASNQFSPNDEGPLTCQQQLEIGGDYSICRHVESGEFILNLPIECESSDGPDSSVVSPKRRINWSLGVYNGVHYIDGQGFFNVKIPANQKHFSDELVLKGKSFIKTLNIARMPTVLTLTSEECGL